MFDVVFTSRQMPTFRRNKLSPSEIYLSGRLPFTDEGIRRPNPDHHQKRYDCAVRVACLTGRVMYEEASGAGWT
jgi:hypothetical protein